MKRNHPILVTGANGLAGSAIVEHLRANEYTCVVGATRQDADLRDQQETMRFIHSVDPRVVIHTAALVYGLGGNMSNQGSAFLDNTLINTNVIHAAHTSGYCTKFVAMGTNAAYPWPTTLPFREEMLFSGRPDVGEYGYGHAKRHMLAMLETYQMDYGFEYTYLVSGNLYGKRDTFNAQTGHVIPSLIKKFATAIDRNGMVDVWGSGVARRDFLYVEDLARIVHLAMSKELRSGAMNIGSGETVTIADLVAHLCDVTGLPPERVRWDATKPEGRIECHADLSKLNSLGFTPNFCLRNGLHQTWLWFREQQRRRAAR